MKTAYHNKLFVSIIRKSIYFAVSCTTMAHPNQRTITKMRGEKSAHDYAFLRNSHIWCNYDQSRYFSALPLYNCQRYDHQMLSFYQVLYQIFFSIAFIYLYPATLMLTLSYVITNKWHLSALLFKSLFWNHSNKAFGACSKAVLESLMLLATMYRVFSSA